MGASSIPCTFARTVPTGDLSWEPSCAATADVIGSPAVLVIRDQAGQELLSCSTNCVHVCQVQPTTLIVTASSPLQNGSRRALTDGRLMCLRFTSTRHAEQLLAALGPTATASNQLQQSQQQAMTHSAFEIKTDKGSADLYFNYYGRIQHQQNMLQDYVRTGVYHAAITQNSVDFAGKVVMDVGAGSGILSLFAAQAGARRVYAVEASSMATFARQLVAGNSSFANVVEVVQAKLEEVNLPEKVDVLISEPMGTLLVNERMIETYIIARDRWLKPGGKMFPQVGRIHVAAFSDEVLHNEVAAKAVFWLQNAFFGVNMTPLYNSAAHGYFSQPVIDAIDPSCLMSTCATHILDFATCTETQLQDIVIPLHLRVTAAGPCVIHGVATWFDVLFQGSQTPLWLSTAPGLPTTHWFQLRCLLAQPIFVVPGAIITGQLRLVAHRHQSYDVQLRLEAAAAVPGGQPQVATCSYDLKEPYYRQLTMATAWQPDSTS